MNSGSSIDSSSSVCGEKRSLSDSEDPTLLCSEIAPKATKAQKRLDVIRWDDYFMAISFLSSMRSKDPSTQVGACIVNTDKRIVGIGYNGFPRGCSDDELPWCRQAENELDTKYPVRVLGACNNLWCVCCESRTLRRIYQPKFAEIFLFDCWHVAFFLLSLIQQYVCHAEVNAILNKNSADVRGCSVSELWAQEDLVVS